MIEEEWRTVYGYGDYEVSSFGRVMRVVARNSGVAGRMLSAKPNNRGYCQVCLSQGGDKKVLKVHRLVAIAFLGPPFGTRCTVNHRDLDKTNNFVYNLEWISHVDNVRHAVRAGAHPHGETNGMSVLTDDDVLTINAAYSTNNITMKELGTIFEVDRTTISKVVNGKTWKHI